MSEPTRLERCQDAVVWWWPEFKTEDSIPLVVRANGRVKKITSEDWEDAYEMMAEYLA